ncbi:SbcC/MukB-like Walker B domain-containing protein [Actinocorallia sp. A-T 12471]|uniref:SbcC/MukB-like Walker B domain-containing protein n=1 Tax=Actinocorallia sp. A-T 12471 TaxID=3089813 RepID=UPI0029D3E1F4|nr:SbcC/MukB-like Walker B domain-containing protein [Actinocorallia sp. A-T 12471]MDX6738757.1 SbcC/MukB-like Walker B domain-containing protein [Actinocorallia sp. A-T 12471]
MTRFRPSRAGLINIWDYVDEEFVFADGRLVLRGHNGSGKTKALEVLFPFVLDGVTDARRLDPFSGENRTMKSNLLYRGQDSEYGFVWMEFTDRMPGDDVGDARVVTLIVALRAHKDRPKVATSFFVTDRRVGVDFGLLSHDARPLTEKHLREALGPRCCFATATEYRDAIDAALFGLGRQRYTQLIDLLLALRRPLLAKDLDPEKVSATLTAGLSPVAEELVDRAARDFDNLAEVQSLVDDLTAADSAVASFLAVYAAYLRAHAGHQVERAAEASRQAVARAAELRDAAREAARAGSAEQDAVAEREQAAQRHAALAAELSVLQADEAYRSRENLRELRDRAVSGRKDLADRQRMLATLERRLSDLNRETEEFAGRLGRRAAEAAETAEEQERAARAAGIAHDAADLATVRAAVAVREDDLREVGERLEAAEKADAERTRREEALARADERLAVEQERCTGAETAVETARAEARAALGAWAERWSRGPAPLVTPDDAAALRRAVDEAALPEAPALAALFGELSEPRRAAIVEEQAEAKAALRTRAEERERLAAERAQIAAETQDAPARHPARDAGPVDRAGGPLWRLVRFADHVDGDGPAAASLEAALEAAGLLTAWVPEDPGAIPGLLAEGGNDAYLRPLPPGQRPDGPTLADVLVPEEPEGPGAAALRAVLASIALVDAISPEVAAPAIGADGGFTYGVQIGVCRKDAPEFIGPAHRAARRARRLAAHDALIAAAEAEIAKLEDVLSGLGERLARLAEARGGLPALGGVLTALGGAATASALLAAARTTRAEAALAAERATAEAASARRLLRSAAAERNLPTEPEGLRRTRRAVADCLAAAERVAAERAEIAAEETRLGERREMAEGLAEEVAENAGLLAERAEAQAELEDRLTALETTLDAPLKQILAKVEAAERALAEEARRKAAAEELARKEHDLRIAAESACGQLRAALVGAVATLLEVAQAVAPFTEPEVRPVLGIAGGPGLWPHPARWPDAGQAAEEMAGLLAEREPEEVVADLLPDEAGTLLRALAEVTRGAASGVEARRRAGRELTEALQRFDGVLGGSGQGYRLEWEAHEAFVSVRVHDGDGRHPVGAFAARVRERAEEQRLLLEDRERRVLEDELLGELAQQIYERVFAARDLVEGMDADTRSRPMSNGTTVGIRWVPSAKLTDAERAVSALLNASGLGREQLAELRDGLRGMLHEYRAAHPRATSKEALAAVLDYRSWRSFELRLKVPGQDEVKLTRRQHSLMSGGEKSAAIHLPLFAAANALYGSAKPDCPRMIALDEAFAGIDDRYKPDLLGLTVKYDLDVFMTGHDLWIRYATVPAAAHYDMHSDKVSHTVSAMLILWDGAELLDSGASFTGNDALATALLGFTPTRRTPTLKGLLQPTP